MGRTGWKGGKGRMRGKGRRVFSFLPVQPLLPFLPVLVLPLLPVLAAAAQERNPYPIFTADNFVAAMKTVGQAFTAVEGSLKRNEADDAKAYLAISRDRLATTITFWRDRSKDDAIGMLRDALAKLDGLDTALSVEHVDQAAIAASVRQASAACERCHAVYREQDPATKTYRFKNGLQ
jgi:cytochrome c556